MARIRLSGGIVLAGDQRVWLAADPGGEVDGSRAMPGAPVVVGPAGAGRGEVARARREAGRLITVGGPLVAAASPLARSSPTCRCTAAVPDGRSSRPWAGSMSPSPRSWTS
jgi:hypothetical protein